jgi:hypothetical protein
MTIKELKEFIKDLPDDMPVGLLDMSTDDFTDGNYSLSTDNFMIDDYVKEEGDMEPLGKALFITFENHLNENPI